MSEARELTQGFANVHGAQLRYELVGVGQPLVMLHGHLLDSGQWDAQVAAFADRYQVLRYDQRGFGESSPVTEPFTHHEDLHGLLQTLGIERAILMGCSGGGAVCFDFALTYPHMVEKIIGVGAGLGGFPFPDEPPSPLIFELMQAYERGDLAQAVELLTQLWTDGVGRTPEQVNPVARARVKEMSMRMASRPRPTIEPEPIAPPAYERLDQISVPVLMIVGANDLPTILEVAEAVATGVAGARKVVMPDAAHHPNMEHPAQFNRIVGEFLG